jgi:translocation and assembly module TamB
MKAGKITKIGLVIVASLLAMFLVLFLLIQFSAVQTFVVRYIADNLSTSLGTTVQIEKVRLKFFKTVSLKNVYIEDLQGDTLLYAGQIDGSIGLFSLLRKKLSFNEISLTDNYIQLKRKQNDPQFNFQFIIDHFSSGEPSTRKPWAINLGKLKITDSKFLINDQFTGQDITADIGSLGLYLNRFNLAEKLIAIRQFGLGDSRVIIHQIRADDHSTKVDTAPGFVFPNTGWTFSAEQIRLDENEFIYQVGDPDKPTHLNFQNLQLEDITFFADNFSWSEDDLRTTITRSAFRDHSGFVLENISGDFVASPHDVSVVNLELRTPHSYINQQTHITLSDLSKARFFSDSVHLTAKFNDAIIDYHDLRLIIPDFEQIAFINTQLQEKIHLTGTLQGYVNNLDFRQFQVQAGNLVYIHLNGSLYNITKPENTRFSLTLNKLHTSYNSIRQLTRNIPVSPGLAYWQDFKLSGTFRGNFNNMTGSQVKLETGSVTRFDGDFDIKGLSHPETAVFNITVRDLRSISEDLKGFSVKPLPAVLDSLGQFYYAGTFQGTIHDFRLDGQLASDAGRMNTDIKMTFDSNYTDASYSGDLALDSFNLGKVLSMPDLGYLTMDINLFGNGLQSDVLRATVLGEVEHLDYRGYHYQDLLIDGRFDKRQFAGHASIDDPNVAFDFDGLVSLEDSLSRFRFRALIDTIDFNALQFLPMKLGMKGYLEADFSGTSPDEIKGMILGTRLQFSNLTDSYQLDSLLLLSDFSQQDERSLEIQSDLAKGILQGDFTLEGLSRFITSYTNRYFPIRLEDLHPDTLLSEGDSLDAVPIHQNFTFDIKLYHIDRLLGLVIPAIEKMDTILLNGQINSRQNHLQIDGYAHQIIYNGMSFGPSTIRSRGDEHRFDNTLTVNNTYITKGVEFPSIHLDATLVNDSMYLGLLLEDQYDTTLEKLNLAALMTAEDHQYKLHLNNNLVLNGRDWQVDPRHQITLKDGKFLIENLELRHNNQLLKVATREIQPTDDFLSAFSFDFENFRLSEISQLLDMKDAFYTGEVNGNFTLRNMEKKVNYLADLTLSDLTIRNERIGNLVIKSQQRTSDIIDVLVRLDGGISALDIRGTYNRLNSEIDIQGEIDQLELKNLDPFLKQYITGSEGKISGMVHLGGTSGVPVIDGNLELEKVSTLINYLQARYTFVNEDIAVRQNKMTFRNFTILDENGNQATINGVADFKTITDPTLDLKFNTSRFLVLNTPANSVDFYYGKLLVDADVEMTGRLSTPSLQVNAKTLDGTDFVLQPLVSQSRVQQEDFIIFANPEDYQYDTTISLQDFYKISGYNFDVSANIEATPDAQLTIVIDPGTGDKLVCRGTGNLAIDISPDGDPKILGNYIITNGQYAFNFQRVLKRTFEIEPGSRVDFVGDIFKSKFDISASYNVQTSTYELIKNQSTLNPIEETRSRQRSDVAVQLKLTGTLERPEAKFDITIEDRSGNGLTSTVASKLTQLREDESSMNKQVFGLLIFNSFIAEQQTTSASLLSDASQSVLLSSVSSLLTNELNRLAKRYIKGIDLDFGVASYSGRFEEGSGVITELKVGLSKRLLNDRLTIKLGGNVQFQNNEDVSLVNNQNSTFSGDFVLEYQLTPDGNYNLRFFQVLSNEENFFNPGVNYSETGASIFFTKSFNSKKYQLQLDEQ